MKKLITSIIIGSVAISGIALATPYKLNVLNNSQASNIELYSSTDQANTKPLPNTGTKTTQSTLDTTNQYQIRIPNKQIFGSLKQDNTYFTLQNTPAAAGPGIQNLKVTVEANGQTGSYQTVGSANPTGICSPDQSGVTCELGSSAPNQINITLSGGTKPDPQAGPKIIDKGKWNPDTAYSRSYTPKPGSIDKVEYNGDQYLSCWYEKGKAPGTDAGWKQYTKGQTVKDVCGS
jgi:hypothetical protein